MVRVFYNQNTEQLIKKHELTPDAILLGSEFSTVVQNGDIYTAIKTIKKIINYLKRLI